MDSETGEGLTKDNMYLFDNDMVRTYERPIIGVVVTERSLKRYKCENK